MPHVNIKITSEGVTPEQKAQTHQKSHRAYARPHGQKLGHYRGRHRRSGHGQLGHWRRTRDRVAQGQEIGGMRRFRVNSALSRRRLKIAWLPITLRNIRRTFVTHHSRMDVPFMHNFPRSCCEIASLITIAVLQRIGYSNVFLYQGETPEALHLWLSVEGVNVDMTYDQEEIHGVLYGFNVRTAPYAAFHGSRLPAEDIETKTKEFKIENCIQGVVDELTTLKVLRLNGRGKYLRPRPGAGPRPRGG